MPRTARKVDELADEGEHMTDALGTVLTVAEEQGTVTWSDVSDDISSGEWGRLIEKGLIVDAGGDGFVLDDPDGVRDALDDADPADSG
ncbi:HTR-like protein, partial [Halobacteriales archaeon SW_7_65_23]